jgi:hypothetical protein
MADLDPLGHLASLQGLGSSLAARIAGNDAEI